MFVFSRGIVPKRSTRRGSRRQGVALELEGGLDVEVGHEKQVGDGLGGVGKDFSIGHSQDAQRATHGTSGRRIVIKDVGCVFGNHESQGSRSHPAPGYSG